MQIRSKLLLAALLACCLAVALSTLRRPAPALGVQPVIPVRVISVEQRDVPRSLDAIGAVKARHNVEVRPQIDGLLMRIAVKEGQQVKTGDLLAVFDDRAARATLAQATAQLRQSQAQLRVAQIDLDRYRQLGGDKSISHQVLDQQHALTEQLEAAVAGDQASVALAQVQLSHTLIHSPASGRVGIRNIDPGNVVRAGDAQGLFSVTQLDPITVEFALPQRHLAMLHQLAGQIPPAQVQARADEGSEGAAPLGEGHLVLIDNQVAGGTGTVRVKAEFANPHARLWPGQLVNVSLATEPLRDALVVPTRVVQRGLENHFAYRVNGEEVESVPLRVLFQNSELTVVEGVARGDTLVSDGQSRLKPGARVQVVGESSTASAKGPAQ
ncbi:efflux RND transporter periplasmic adaptor subunit [Pseudomonas sp. HR96]|uniref:efflux RND transporter periplasmic adaptor subunit n=1 Tax=Pseudomonas sp. HR96 TaxID=1027966 RepID=UPI002A749A56|nr:efflux RND transporter periplasmic adaptor subunit [Pseudomonas sp. HR96]WPP00791.1 efflux RND transporter periplasmic adaptor subunit [Pseudomonas sp. HR96]